MGGVSLDELGPWDGYSCPWCPTVVLVVDDQASAVRVMETHLDGHFAHAVGRPTPGPVVPRPRVGSGNTAGAA